jgi:hypothetical protein
MLILKQIVPKKVVSQQKPRNYKKARKKAKSALEKKKKMVR